MGVQLQSCRLFVALAGIALIIGVALFGKFSGETRLWVELQNTGHIPLFGVMAIAILVVMRELTPAGRDRPVVGYLLAAVICWVIGIGVEFGQLLTRNHAPDLADVGLDLAGILLFLMVYSVIDPYMKPVWCMHRPGLRLATLVLSVGLVSVLLAPLASLVIAYKQRDAAIPVIIDFNARWSGYFLELRDTGLYPDMKPVSVTQATDRRLARLAVEPGRYRGVSVVEPYPDWSGYEYLVVEIYSGALHPHSLTLHVHDRQYNQVHTDRFNQALNIDRGMNVFRIPLAVIEIAPAGRAMDMTRIVGLALFAHQVKRPFDLYLGKIWLE